MVNGSNAPQPCRAKVLSPPRGMVTPATYNHSSHLSNQRSKPTGWDGGLFCLTSFTVSSCPVFQAHRVGWRSKRDTRSDAQFPRSKPTVWDGDLFFVCFVPSEKSIPSPPCGMVTHIRGFWRLGIQLVPSPLCGMATCPVELGL